MIELLDLDATDAHTNKDWRAQLVDMGYSHQLPLQADLSLSVTNGQAGGSGARGQVALLPLVAESAALANARDLELVLAWANAGLFPKTVESFEAILASQGKLVCEMIGAPPPAPLAPAQQASGEWRRGRG